MSAHLRTNLLLARIGEMGTFASAGLEQAWRRQICVCSLQGVGDVIGMVPEIDWQRRTCGVAPETEVESVKCKRLTEIRI